MTSELLPARLLLFCAAFSTPKTNWTVPVALPDFRRSVLVANHGHLARVATVHSPMLDGINLLKMVRITASRNVALVMNMLSRRTMKRLIYKAVNLAQFGGYSDMAITISVLGTCPDPAAINSNEARVQGRKCFMRKHCDSIHSPGFNASEAGAVEDDSAVPQGFAHPTGSIKGGDRG